MISKSFPIRAFVALLIIASSLTSPVNATAIAPAFARDRRRDSVPASAMARFIEERQTVEFLEGCPANPGPNDEDKNCLFYQENLLACQDTVANNDFTPLVDCLNGLCPDNTPGVNFCEAAKALHLIKVV